MRLTLTGIDRPWYGGDYDDEIVMVEVHGDYDVFWNKVPVGRVEKVPGGFVARLADGQSFSPIATPYPNHAAVACCDAFHASVQS